jgi:hypothetical protein
MLFSEGWAFFVPYLLVYVVGLLLGLTKGSVRAAFVALHPALLVLLAAFLVRRARLRPEPWRLLQSTGFWFWLTLTLVLVLPGAYLEFPGDPWEHVRRLNLSRADQPMRDGSVFVFKFAYFWGWSFLSWVEPAYQRWALGALSAFWQLLLSFQFYRFSRRLGFTSAWSRVQVLGVVAFFGTDVFSFLRYYALSSTPLAYIAYLRGASAMLDLAEGKGSRSRSAVVLAACLAIITFNHLQELFLTAIFATAIVACHLGERLHATGRARPRILALLLAWLLTLAGGRLVTAQALAFGLDRFGVPALWPWLSRFGILRIWDPRLNFWPAIGLVGLIALGLALFRPRAHRLLAAVTLAPVVVLLFPPLCLAFVAQSHPGNAYRMLFALPSTFMVVAVLRDVFHRISGGVNRGPLWAGVGIGLLGLVPAAPVWGKLPFQLYRTPAALSLVRLDEAAQWFLRNRKLEADCIVKSDGVTEFAIASLLGRRSTIERVSGRHLIFGRWGPWTFSGPAEMDAFRKFVGLCGYLAPETGAYPPAAACGRSWIGAQSGHWPADSACLAAQLPPRLTADCESLTTLGWTRTFVPPFYWYYEPPR